MSLFLPRDSEAEKLSVVLTVHEQYPLEHAPIMMSSEDDLIRVPPSDAELVAADIRTAISDGRLDMVNYAMRPSEFASAASAGTIAYAHTMRPFIVIKVTS